MDCGGRPCGDRTHATLLKKPRFKRLRPLRDCLFELKHDGFGARGHHRALSVRAGLAPGLRVSSGRSYGRKSPTPSARRAVLDAEIVCLKADRRSDFYSLMFSARLALLLRVRSAVFWRAKTYATARFSRARAGSRRSSRTISSRARASWATCQNGRTESAEPTDHQSLRTEETAPVFSILRDTEMKTFLIHQDLRGSTIAIAVASSLQPGVSVGGPRGA